MAKHSRNSTRKGRGNANGGRAPLALDEAPGHLLRRCHRRSREIYEELVGAEGISRQQYAVLIAMARSPGASLTAISDATGFDRNTLAEMIGRLAKKGYVTRRRSAADARASEIALTPSGARFVDAMMPRAHEVQRRILAPLPAELRPVFVQCLRILLGLEPARVRQRQGSDSVSQTRETPFHEHEFDRQDLERLQALEESMWRSETRGDREYMERTLTPNFFEFGRSGRVYTRGQIIDLSPGEIRVKFPFRNFKVTPIGADAALVTYASDEGLEKGNRSSIWLKTRAGWQLNFHQGTAVPDRRP